MKKSLRLRIVKALIPCFSLLFLTSLFVETKAQICVPPVAKINGKNVSICDPTSSFTGLTAASASETWAVVTTPANPAVATINPITGAVTGMTVNGTYRFVLSNSPTCSDTVIVDKKLETNVTTADVITCIGGNINLTANSTTTMATYLWAGPLNFTSAQQNPSIANIINGNKGNYTVTVTSQDGCTASAVAKIGLTNIAVSLIAGKTSYCVGENIILRTFTPETGYIYDWKGPNGFSSMNTLNVTIPTTPSKAQQGVYSMVITDPSGCAAVTTMNITITECLSIGNLVWNDANNDGFNNNSEVGVEAVPVKLYKATLDGGGNPTDVPNGAAIASTTTSTIVGSVGKYVFSGLVPGYYIVEIEAPADYKTSTGTNGATTGTYEPALSPNNDVNDNDDGTQFSVQIIRSKAIELRNYTEPTADGDVTTGDNADKNSNLTIDFGILKPDQICNPVVCLPYTFIKKKWLNP
jgi:hypothetical protein